jgi:hypothetical protein
MLSEVSKFNFKFVFEKNVFYYLAPEPDPHSFSKLDPDPHKASADLKSF